MGVMWTTEQQRVIDARGCNILVSAAAGSGKTAVLVERIITMITDPVHPVDIDRLLIVTFTRAAAGEMRERIRLAIEKKLAEDEDNEHLQKQSTLLHHAQITTIDSFCSYVVKNYFHLIDLDPSYRMAEEGELRLMQGDVAAQVLDDAYGRKEPEFLQFVECFSTGKTDEGIEDMIKRLYTFSVSYPYPEEWLLSCKEAYHISSKEELEQAGWMQMIKEDIQKSLQEAMSLADAALDTAMGEGGPYYYENALQSDRTFIQKLLETDSFEEWQKLFSGLAFARLSAKKDPQVSEEAKELTKNLRQQVKDLLGELREQYFSLSLDAAARYVQMAGGPVRVLIDLTLQFTQAYAEKKREKNILDFPDLEHFALKILVDHSQEGDRRTQAAKELAGRFAEVMIDEYQDSNFVQEKLLNAVSKMEDGSNNIFMVGDVKQSIYRFRLARPDLFMEKFKTYSTAGGDCLRIDLHKNFRSRKEVLDGVNFLFYQIMGEALGKVEYDEAAALYPGASFPPYGKEEENSRLRSASLAGQDEDTETPLLKTDGTQWKSTELPLVETDEAERQDRGLPLSKTDGTQWKRTELPLAETDEAEHQERGLTLPMTDESMWKDTELLLVETDEEEWKVMESGENVQELEARAVAGKIQEIVGSYPVLDKATGKYRPARFSDCVILLRTLSGWSETFKRVLNAQGIPASVTTKTGYFSASEVMTVLNYLRILDNPLQDIPFTGAIHNLPSGFSMEELARVKCAGKEKEISGMYQALLAAETLHECEDAEDRKIGEKAHRFLELYRSIRKKVPYTPMHELLWEIYDRTGLFDYIRAGASGEQQKANLLMLLQKARDYESTSYRGLFNFVRYIENLQKYQVDFGEANILSENEDTVKIMSIHKSKGLEFPVVFVSGLGKQFNQQDARASLVMHPDLGVGADWVDAKYRTKTPTLLKKAVQRQIQIENLGEELRILYVALTRAKEKLILTGCTSRLEKRLTALEPLKKQEERRISYGRLVKARCYLDWIFPALARHRCMDRVYLSYEKRPYALNPLHNHEAGFRVQVISPAKLTLEEAETRMIQMMKKQEILGFDTNESWDKDAKEQIEECFTYTYPYPDREKIPAKVTVSELKRLHMEDEESTDWYEEEEVVPYIPSFIEKREEGLTGAGRGTAYHRVFECLDFSKAGSVQEVEEQLASLESGHRIDREVRRTVSPRDVYQFAVSSIGKRMAKAQAAGMLYREQPFVMGISADRLREEYAGDESVLVQGIIDAFFYEDGRIILVDYKTDRVRHRNGSDLVEKYRVQLDYYTEALERMTGRKVSERYIYSVDMQKELIV